MFIYYFTIYYLQLIYDLIILQFTTFRTVVIVIVSLNYSAKLQHQKADVNSSSYA